MKVTLEPNEFVANAGAGPEDSAQENPPFSPLNFVKTIYIYKVKSIST